MSGVMVDPSGDVAIGSTTPTAGPDGTVLVPVVRTRGRSTRPVGAYEISARGVRFHPVVEPGRLAAYGAVALVAFAAAHAWRRPPAIGSVSMGPGGWVSLKGASLPPLRASACQSRRRPSRPWWAHLLRAHRLVVQR
jgi:hypothetical protein